MHSIINTEASLADLIHVTVKEEHDAYFMAEIQGKHLHTQWDTGVSKSCINYDTYKS